jgi:hypothetical protein
MATLSSTLAIEKNRDRLAEARHTLSMAEASLNGIVARLAAGHLDITYRGADPLDEIRGAVDRVFWARDALDAARFAALPFDTISGSQPTPNDRDDMADMLIHAHDRLRLGVDDEARFRDPVHAADRARADEASK